MGGIAVIGSGGHATAIMDLLQAAGREVAGVIDDDPQRVGHTLLGVPIVGGREALTTLGHDEVVVAIGDNRARAAVFASLRAAGEALAVVVHPSAVVAPSALLGAGSMICVAAIVGPEAVIGENVIINTAASVDHHNVIDAHAHLAPGVRTGGAVRIGEGAVLGIGSVVLPGCTIGGWSIIGGGATVIDDVADGVTVIGVPAKPIGRADR